VFLLKQFGADGAPVVPAADLQVPVSSSEAPATVAVSVVVSLERILVDGVPVVDLAPSDGGPVVPEANRDGLRIAPLVEALAGKAEVAAARTGPDARPPEILFQADRRLPFDVIRRAMLSASAAGFTDFRFVVLGDRSAPR
jgi:hypothetical protein